MNKPELKLQFDQLLEQVQSFFGRGKPPAQAQKQFRAHVAQSLEQIPSMGEVLKEYPFYGAVAFLGKFEFSDCPMLASLAEGTDAKKLAIIREKQSVRIAESAKPAWDHLLGEDPETLCVILALCFMSSKNVTIRKAVSDE